MRRRQVMAAALAVVIAAGSILVGYGSSKGDDSAAQQSGQEQTDTSGQSGEDQPGSSQPDEGNGGQTTVTPWVTTVTGEHQKSFDWFADYVTGMYPDIKVDMLGTSGDLSDYKQKLDVAIRAGTTPNITNGFHPELVLNGYYENPDPHFKNQEDRDKISEALIKSSKTYDPAGEGFYVLLHNSQIWSMWVRPDWLREIEMDVPTSWNDFFTAVEKMTDASNDKYDPCIRGGASSTNTLETLMYTYFGLDHYFTEDGESTANDPKSAKFIQKYLIDYYNIYMAQNSLTKDQTDLVSSFQSGKAGVVVHNLGSATSMVQAFEESCSKFQAAKPPARDGGYVVHAELMSLGLSMNSQSQGEEAVWKAISLYLSKKVSTKYCQLYGEIPVSMKTTWGPLFEGSPYMGMGVNIEINADIKFSDTPYYFPTYSNIQSDTESNIQTIIPGEMTPQELLDTWATTLEEAHVDYNEPVKQ